MSSFEVVKFTLVVFFLTFRLIDWLCKKKKKVYDESPTMLTLSVGPKG